MDGVPEANGDGERRAADQPASQPNSQPASQPAPSAPAPDSGAPAASAVNADDPAKKTEEQDEQTRKRRRPVILIIGVILLLCLIVGGVYFYLSGLNLESTDDAYTDGRVVSLAPQVAGEVVSLDVNDNQFVHAGDPIIHINPHSYIIARDQAKGALDAAKSQAEGQRFNVDIAKKNFPAILQQAQAQVTQAQANLAKSQADYDRQRNLPRAATTQQAVDAALAAFRQAQAQVMLAQAQVAEASPVPERIGNANAQFEQLNGSLEQAQARLDQAELDLSRTIVRAPQDGWITKRNVEKGNYVAAGQQILSIVSPDVWITANFKENQLDSIRRGQQATIKVDAYPSLTLHGHVDSVQLGSGSKFSAFPPENATGNFVKIVQRVPVKIVIDSGLDPQLPLPLGLSVDPTVFLK